MSNLGTYVILWADSRKDLEAKVNTFFETHQAWKCAGGVVIDGDRYLQAVAL